MNVPAATRRRGAGIDRGGIVEAGFALIETGGLDALTMRDVAARLGVQAPALYWHVANKADLIALMAGRIHADARAGVDDAADWRDWLIRFGRGLRRAFGTHRDGARLCAIAPPLADPAGAAAAIAAPLVARGLTRAQAITYQASVISLTLGWALYEENGPMHAFLAEMMDVGAAYEAGLAALVAGFPAD